MNNAQKKFEKCKALYLGVDINTPQIYGHFHDEEEIGGALAKSACSPARFTGRERIFPIP